MPRKLRLLPSADVAALGKRFYLFDRAAIGANIVCVPTQRISKRLFDVVTRIRRECPAHAGQTLEEFEALFSEAGARSLLAQLVSAGYLEEVTPLPAGEEEAGTGHAARLSSANQADYFRTKGLHHYFRRPSFFNLPEQIEDSEADVGIIGVPVSSVPVSNGTVAAPMHLRQDTQRAGFWCDFWAKGVYTEIGCDDSPPRLLCKGIVLKDFGDVGREARTIGDLFTEVSELIESRLLPNRIRALFVGGDHAVTFPIVDCYLKHHPSLVLLHLDAHNDLFYTEYVEYNHAGPIHALLLHSDLRKVLSFGLRTTGDPRVDPFTRLTGDGVINERVHLYSIAAVRRWLMRPEAFREHLLARVGRGAPCYLTIDLDVLSADSIGGQLSTPAGPGLEWYELFELVDLIMGELDVIGCDVVELNPERKSRSSDEEREPSVLLMQLVDGLARAARRAEDGSAVVAARPEPQRDAPPGRDARTPRECGSQQNGSTSFGRPVDRRAASELSYGDFLREYAIPGRPLVLTGLDAFWPAMSRWTLDYFLDKSSPEEQVEVCVFSRPGDLDSRRRTYRGLRDILSLMRRRRGAEPEADGERYYISNWGFLDEHPELSDDYQVPPFFAMELNERLGMEASAFKWIYIGEAGTGSPTHSDVVNSSAWLMLTEGRKQWRIVPTSSLEACGHVGDWANLFEPDFERYPDLASIDGYETVQETGEIIWTPPLCVHAVRNLEFGIAITQNYIDLTNLAEVFDATAGGPRALKPQRPPVNLLPGLVRQGLANLRAHGFAEEAQPLVARLSEAFSLRGVLNEERQRSLDLALEELRRWRS